MWAAPTHEAWWIRSTRSARWQWISGDAYGDPSIKVEIQLLLGSVYPLHGTGVTLMDCKLITTSSTKNSVQYFCLPFPCQDSRKLHASSCPSHIISWHGYQRKCLGSCCTSWNLPPFRCWPWRARSTWNGAPCTNDSNTTLTTLMSFQVFPTKLLASNGSVWYLGIWNYLKMLWISQDYYFTTGSATSSAKARGSLGRQPASSWPSAKSRKCVWNLRVKHRSWGHDQVICRYVMIWHDDPWCDTDL